MSIHISCASKKSAIGAIAPVAFEVLENPLRSLDLEEHVDLLGRDLHLLENELGPLECRTILERIPAGVVVIFGGSRHVFIIQVVSIFVTRLG